MPDKRNVIHAEIVKRKSKVGRPSLGEVDPEKETAVLKLIESGIAINDIANACGVDRVTVHRLRDRAETEGRISSLRPKWGRVSLLAVDRLITAIESGEIPSSQMGWIAGMAMDKALALKAPEPKSKRQIKLTPAQLGEAIAAAVGAKV